MTVPALSAKNFYDGMFASLFRWVGQWADAVLSVVARRSDHTSPQQRRAFAIAGSVLLHLGLLLLLLPAKSGLSASMGAVTGLGDVNGVGTAVTLVDVSELTPTKQPSPENQAMIAYQPAETAAASQVAEPTEDALIPSEPSDASIETKRIAATETIQSDSKAASDSATEATAGAFGEHGQSNLDLWNAIAPCWNQIAGSATLPAALKITFDAAGGLALPPEIERDPDAPITDQSLKSEAEALQALAECGAYPMAQGQQNVVVRFPAPGQMSGGAAGSSGQMAAVVQ